MSLTSPRSLTATLLSMIFPCDVKEYLDNPQRCLVIHLATQPCLQCAFPHLHAHQWRDRQVQFFDELVTTVVLRACCPICGATITLLPDFLSPYGRYAVPVREEVVSAATSAPCCDPRTARRWRAAFRAQVEEVVQAVTAVCSHGPASSGLLGRPRTSGWARLRELRDTYGRWIGFIGSSVLGWVNSVSSHYRLALVV